MPGIPSESIREAARAAAKRLTRYVRTNPMKKPLWILPLLLSGSPARADSPTPSAQQVLGHVLDSDSWGLSGASISAHATLTDKTGAKSELSFSARSKRLGPGVSESLVRFSAPAELAGAGFLQIQKQDADDERFLFLPDLKRSRRISGGLRANAFMGTDMSFADLDRRDLRDSTVSLTGSEPIEKWDCFKLEVLPKRADSQYSRVELWARKDNYVTLRMKMYDRSKSLVKVFTTLEVRRVSGQWFISKSKMVNQQQAHTTELFLDQISTSEQFSDDDFTVRALEKSR